MARTPLTFQAAFDDVCIAAGFTAVQVVANAALQGKLLRIFNRSYQVGMDTCGGGWEDARTGAMITPSAKMIDYSVLGDAREFEVWTKDPRSDDSGARSVSCNFAADGIYIREENLPTVWVAWMPETVAFDLTEWVTGTTYAVGDKRVLSTTGKAYRCLVAHTAAAFADDLTASKWVLMPVLGILHEFLIQHSQGIYLSESGQPETGFKMMAVAKRDLAELAVRELDRRSPS